MSGSREQAIRAGLGTRLGSARMLGVGVATRIDSDRAVKQARLNKKNKTAIFGRSPEKMTADGVKSTHIRWHVNRNLFQPKCEFCQASLDTPALPEASGNPA